MRGNWRGARGDEGDEVGEPERPLRDGINLVADADVLPVACGRPAGLLGEDVLLDRLDFGVGPRVWQLDLTALAALLHFRAFEAHARADEGRDQLVILIPVFLAQEVLDPPAAEIAILGRPLEPVEHDPRRDPVSDLDWLVEPHRRFAMKAAEARPTDLHRTKAGDNEAGRRDLGTVVRGGAVGRIGPERIVVADPLQKR